MATVTPDSLLTESWLGAADIWLLASGKHLRSWEKLGAHPCTRNGVSGTVFAVWAPNAVRLAVVGDFNQWDADQHLMHLHVECGVWDVFVEGVTAGSIYKFAITAPNGSRVLKIDPYGFQAEPSSGHASIVMPSPEPAVISAERRARANRLSGPVSIYEVHVGSWRRTCGHLPDWDTLAQTLIPYAADMGFTHLELMPISEHPFYGSWGYQPTGLYAPSARYGSPGSFRNFVAAAHAADLLVLLDWVPAHFPDDADALARFDGTFLYEHADPREGLHRDWHTLIYNYSRHEVRNFLVSNALFWVERYGVDGLRVDAVASMLYRDYSRAKGEWIPNRDGGRENYEAIDFLREVNQILGQEAPGAVTVAEESTAYPGVTAPPWLGGLGFNYKWNLGWMHDTLAYFGLDPVYRPHHHDRITFALMYAYSEHFVLALSHDEVVHGKGSLYGKMWGDPWQKRANLRALYALMYAQPGRKLLFMGSELAQVREWSHEAELDWGLLDSPEHAGIQRLVRDLNRLYRDRPALHARDDDPGGFCWIEANDRVHSIFSFVRLGHLPAQQMIVVCNLTPVVRHGYRLGVPQAGVWRAVLNTDSSQYGGSGVGYAGQEPVDAKGVETHELPWQGQPVSVVLSLPPLGVLWLEPAPTP